MRPLLLFAPGAGAPSSHPWMQSWKKILSEIGEVGTFDYGYMREDRKRPDRLPQLIADHRDAQNRARQPYRHERNFLHVVETGDHSLRVSKRQLQGSNQTQEDVDQRVFQSIAEFIAGLPDKTNR